MLVLGGRTPDLPSAREMVHKVIEDGSAFNKFVELVKAQGGDASYIEQPEKMAQARYVEIIDSPHTGYLSQIHARLIGEAAVNLGGGRIKKSDPIDHAVGIEVLHKVGEKIQISEPLFVVHANDPQKLRQAREAILAAHSFSENPVEPLPLFYQ